jgi:energy-coupling factor transporter ATP-binding protein EcfA2
MTKSLNLQQFFQATNPAKTLFVDNIEQDQKYYIDFSSVRGGQIIDELKDNIALWSPDEATCQLFTGHIGCGKSTELLRLKQQLEAEDFHVVYFESSQDLEMGDVDVGDILLAIARRITESLDRLQLDKSTKMQSLLQGAAKLLQTEIEITGEWITPVGKLIANTDGQVSLDMGIAQISAKAKASPESRSKLRDYLEPRTNSILEAINSELIQPAIAKLKQHGKRGLVVIVDSLDKLHNSRKQGQSPQHEYLFVERAEQLRSLHCHVIYTMPLGLRFCNVFANLCAKFMYEPKVLPMVPVTSRDRTECVEGMSLLKEMILARAFPDLNQSERLSKITEIFDSPETLDRLCQISGGHVRNILRLLNDSVKKQKGLPISRNTLETVIQGYRNGLSLAVDDREWVLLRQVAQHQKVSGDDGYETLIRSLFVYEYCDDQGSWFELNPLLAEAKELQE